MLIDLSYFQGPLSIAQISQKAVSDAVTDAVALYEPEMLVKALGYDLYSSFINGLGEDPVPQKWLNLLQGVSYTNDSSYARRWPGFASANDVSYIANVTRNNEFHYAGETTNPALGNPVTFAIGDTKLIDTSLKNWDYTLEIGGFRELNPETEWAKIDGGGAEVLLDGYTTQADELWILRFIGLNINIAAAGTIKISPVANYVWWHYQRDNHVQFTGTGSKKAQAENAIDANPAYKMVRVWNDMREQLSFLWEYLRLNESVYADNGYVYSEIERSYFHPQNVFNI